MQGTGEPAAATADGANELQQLLQQTIEHLHACDRGAAGAGEERHAGARRRRAAAPDTQFLMRAHRQLLSHGAVAARAAGDQREPARPAAPEALPLPRAVLLAALARRALDRRAGAVARGERGGLQRARRAHRRDPGAQGHRRHRVQLRRADRPVHARRRSSSACAPSSPSASAHSPGARSTSTSTSCTSSTTTSACTSAMRVLGAARRADAPAPAARARFARAHLRRPLRGAAAGAAATTPSSFAESLREGAEQLGSMQGEARLRVSISVGVALLESGAGELVHVARRRRDRLQGRQGPRPQPRRGLPAERRQHRAPLRRHQHRRASCATPSTQGRLQPGCAAHPAVRLRRERAAALRAAAAHDR